MTPLDAWAHIRVVNKVGRGGITLCAVKPAAVWFDTPRRGIVVRTSPNSDGNVTCADCLLRFTWLEATFTAAPEKPQWYLDFTAEQIDSMFDQLGLNEGATP